VNLLEAIAKRRSYKRHDGLWDTEKTAVAFLTDYRSGAIGRVSLETPQSRKAMIEQNLIMPHEISPLTQ